MIEVILERLAHCPLTYIAIEILPKLWRRESIMNKDFIPKMTMFSKDFELIRGKPDYEYLTTRAENYLQEEVDETLSACYQKDDAEILDGSGDTAFIAINNIYVWGRMKGKSHTESTNLIYEVMNRIADANLTKLWDGGKVKFNDQGKIVKPPTFKSPDYTDIIKD